MERIDQKTDENNRKSQHSDDDNHHQDGLIDGTDDRNGAIEHQRVSGLIDQSSGGDFSAKPTMVVKGIAKPIVAVVPQRDESTTIMPPDGHRSTATSKLLPSSMTPDVVIHDDDAPPKSKGTKKSTTNKDGDDDDDDQQNFRVYPKRWFILTVVALLNCSNTMSWIAYAPVSNFVDCYYGGSTATWLSLVFLIAAIPVAFVAMWSVRKYGLRSAVLLAAWTNGFGALIRLLSSALPLPAGRYVVLLGQLSAAIAYPFIMFLPTKVAASWFSGSQRATATMITAMSNPLGVLFANLISPQLVVQKSDVLYLNILLSVIPTATIFLATFGVRASDPPTPPGHAASQPPMAFGAGLKKCLTSRAFLMLLLALGGGMGMFNALYTMMQQILCSRGYSNSFAGLCCILMIIGGLCGATASAKIVDLTKRYEETMKVSFGIAVIGGVFFSLIALRPDLKVIIAICCTMFGFFGLAAYPIGLETGAECTYPVAETTSTGLIVLSGQIQGALYIILMEFLSKPLSNPMALDREVCSVGGRKGSGDTAGAATGADGCGPASVQAKDMTVAMIIFACVATVLGLVFIIVFKPRLKRSEMEKTGKAAASRKEQGAGGKGGAKKNDQSKGVEMRVITKPNGKLEVTPDSPLVDNP